LFTPHCLIHAILHEEDCELLIKSKKNPVRLSHALRILLFLISSLAISLKPIRGFTTMRYINRLFTYLLIYLLTYLKAWPWGLRPWPWPYVFGLDYITGNVIW